MEGVIILILALASVYFGIKYRYELAAGMNIRCTRKTDDDTRMKFLIRRIEDDTEEVADLGKK